MFAAGGNDREVPLDQPRKRKSASCLMTRSCRFGGTEPGVDQPKKSAQQDLAGLGAAPVETPSTLTLAVIPVAGAVSVVAAIAVAAVIAVVALTVTDSVAIARAATRTRGIPGANVRRKRRSNVAIGSTYFARN